MNNIQAMLAQVAQGKPLLEFRAGICHQTRSTVSADVRKGKVVLTQNEDGLLKFQWHLRPSDAVEIDLTIFPGGATYEKVNDKGRVYLLKLAHSDVKRFFWMQEPSSEKDEEIAKKVVELIANPPPPAENNVQEMMAGMDEKQQAQLMQMLSHGTMGGGGSARGGRTAARPAASTPAATGAGASGASLAASLTEMAQRLAAGLQGPGGAAGAAGAARPAGPGAGTGSLGVADFVGTQLTDVLDSRRTVPLVDDSVVAEVAEFLPPGQRSRADVIAHLQSPQLQQTLDRMSQLLNGPQFNNLMSSLGLRHTGDIGVNGFLRAIEQEGKRNAPVAATPGSTAAASSGTAPAATSSDSSSTASTTPATAPKNDDKPASS